MHKKLTVGVEQKAVRAYVEALPNPFPMRRATDQLHVLSGKVEGFVHQDSNGEGQVWVVWAIADSGAATVEVPVNNSPVIKVGVNGVQERCLATNNRVQLVLKGDRKMAPGFLLMDRPREVK